MNLSFLEIGLVAALATYRLTFMLNSEIGPARIFARFRTWIGVSYDQHSNPVPRNWRAEAVICFLCLSVWVGGAVWLLVALFLVLGHVEIAVYLLAPLAFSGVAVYLKKAVG